MDYFVPTGSRRIVLQKFLMRVRQCPLLVVSIGCSLAALWYWRRLYPTSCYNSAIADCGFGVLRCSYLMGNSKQQASARSKAKRTSKYATKKIPRRKAAEINLANGYGWDTNTRPAYPLARLRRISAGARGSPWPRTWPEGLLAQPPACWHRRVPPSCRSTYRIYKNRVNKRENKWYGKGGVVRGAGGDVMTGDAGEGSTQRL